MSNLRVLISKHFSRQIWHTWIQARSLRKSGPWTFRKSRPYTKIHCLSWNKFEGANSIHENSFFKITAQNYPIKAFLVSSLSIFILSRNFAIGQIWGRLFQIRQYRSLIQAPKVQFLIPNLRIFFFAANFAI